MMQLVRSSFLKANLDSNPIKSDELLIIDSKQIKKGLANLNNVCTPTSLA